MKPLERRSRTLRQKENLRRSFQPERIRLLFIGEAPPASGRFFYQGDSGLYRAMRDAFCNAGFEITDANFLAAFRSAGCYLVDLCATPVDKLTAKSRRAACRRSEASLAESITGLRPEMIATVVRSIEVNVIQAAAHADWHGSLLHLPYPGRWARNRDIFVDALAPTIRALQREAA